MAINCMSDKRVTLIQSRYDEWQGNEKLPIYGHPGKQVQMHRGMVSN